MAAFSLIIYHDITASILGCRCIINKNMIKSRISYKINILWPVCAQFMSSQIQSNNTAKAYRLTKCWMFTNTVLNMNIDSQ